MNTPQNSSVDAWDSMSQHARLTNNPAHLPSIMSSFTWQPCNKDPLRIRTKEEGLTTLTGQETTMDSKMTEITKEALTGPTTLGTPDTTVEEAVMAAEAAEEVTTETEIKTTKEIIKEINKVRTLQQELTLPRLVHSRARDKQVML